MRSQLQEYCSRLVFPCAPVVQTSQAMIQTLQLDEIYRIFQKTYPLDKLAFKHFRLLKPWNLIKAYRETCQLAALAPQRGGSHGRRGVQASTSLDHAARRDTPSRSHAARQSHIDWSHADCTLHPLDSQSPPPSVSAHHSRRLSLNAGCPTLCNTDPSRPRTATRSLPGCTSRPNLSHGGPRQQAQVGPGIHPITPPSCPPPPSP